MWPFHPHFLWSTEPCMWTFYTNLFISQSVVCRFLGITHLALEWINKQTTSCSRVTGADGRDKWMQALVINCRWSCLCIQIWWPPTSGWTFQLNMSVAWNVVWQRRCQQATSVSISLFTPQQAAEGHVAQLKRHLTRQHRQVNVFCRSRTLRFGARC